MIQIASSQLGCAAGNVTCYCTEPDFGYGVRDCANQACTNASDATTVISFGTSYCASALASYSSTASPSASSITASGLSVLSAATASTTGSGSSGSSTATVT